MDPSQPSPPLSSPPGSSTPTTSSGRAKRWSRKPSVKPDGTWVVERVDALIGVPEPETTWRKWRTTCGAIARTRAAITLPDWTDMDSAERDALYVELKQSFRVPDEDEEAFRRASLFTIGKL